MWRERTLVVGPRAPGEDLEELQIICVVGRFSQRLDLGLLEELGEDVGVWSCGRLRYDICCCRWRGRRFGENKVLLEGIESPRLLHVRVCLWTRSGSLERSSGVDVVVRICGSCRCSLGDVASKLNHEVQNPQIQNAHSQA